MYSSDSNFSWSKNKTTCIHLLQTNAISRISCPALFFQKLKNKKFQYNIVTKELLYFHKESLSPEVYLEPWHTFKIEPFAKRVNGF